MTFKPPTLYDIRAAAHMRCGFHNQVEGALTQNGTRAVPTGRSHVTIVDLQEEVKQRISEAVGWECDFHNQTIETWVESLR